MKPAQFAKIIGVSRQQVAKYVATGGVQVIDGQVDVPASLALLAGRLDDGKLHRATQALGAVTDPVRQAAPAVPLPLTPRQEREVIERDLKRLEYGRLTGELIQAADVEAAAERAVSDMREAFANVRRETADKICAQFGLPPERAAALARMLAAAFETGMGQFSERMAALAAEEEARSG